MKQLLSLVVVAALLSGMGCAKKVVSVHPGAISDYDSYAYDILLVEQSAINEARSQFVAGNLPPAAKGPLNTAITQYNLAEAGWKAYHGTGGDATALQQAIDALVAAVGILQKALGGSVAPAPAGMLILNLGVTA
jgi:hypothetical protein